MSKRKLCKCGEYHPVDNHLHLGTANGQDTQAVASSHHVKALTASGFAFKLQNAGTPAEVALFRDARGPGVDFWPRKGKGAPATTFQGGAQAFLAWYRARWNRA